jgi:RimJ/RimL family protein N-acetyltransferase
VKQPYRITLADLPVAVLPLDEICFPTDKRVNTDDSLWWIIWRDKKPVAYAGLRPCKNPQNKGIGFFCRAGVLPNHRGRGLQKRLIRVRERAARRLGLKEVVTYCALWNCASINSLIRCGYKLYWPASKWAGSGSVYLCKKLK